MMTTKMVPWLDDCMNDKRLNWGIFFVLWRVSEKLTNVVVVLVCMGKNGLIQQWYNNKTSKEILGVEKLSLFIICQQEKPSS